MTKFTSDKPSIDEIMALRKPRTEEFWLPLDNDVLAEISEVEQLLAKARRDDERLNRIPEAPALQERLDGLHEAASEAAARFVCRELPRKQYRDLIRRHPPVEDGRRWNDETFAPELIAACYVDPAISLDQAQAIWETWSDYATSALFGAAIIANEGPSKIPFGVRNSAETPDSGPSSTTAPLEESPTPSS